MTSPLSKIGSVVARTWFPVTLILLFLLAIPGVVLFLMQRAGYEVETNRWLQENFSISFNMPLDWRAALILLLIPLLILVLYFLKLKRKPLEVPSTFLWKKSIEDLHVNSLFQWLRRNVLLLLQLLIALFLIYAVMGFWVYGSVSKGKHYILMIDNSASMNAKDMEGMTRLEWAKREALKEIDAARDGDNGMVIVFNSRATTLQSYTGEKAKLRQAVQSIEPTQKLTLIEEALNLADSLANPLTSTEDASVRPDSEKPGENLAFLLPEGKPTEVYLFSDGRFPDLSESALAQLNSKQAGNTSALGNLNLHFRSAGKPGPENVNNLGIVACNVIRLPQKNKDEDPTILKLQALVRVNNYRPNQANNVKLYLDVLIDGQPEHALQRTLSLPARTIQITEEDKKKTVEDTPGQQTLIFPLPDLDATANIVLHAYLPGLQDDFDLDNQAWVAIGSRRKAKVLIVGSKNVILNAFFNQAAIKKIALVDQLTADELTSEKYRKAATSGDYDLVIFDRCGPNDVKEIPQANTMFIDQPPPPWERGKETKKNMPLRLSGKTHPLLQQIANLEKDVAVHEMFVFSWKQNLREKDKKEFTTDPADKGKQLLSQPNVLVESDANIPGVFSLTRGAYTDVVLTFPIVDAAGDLTTNWPLEQSFPLFLRNVLYVLGNVRDEVRADSVHAGEPMVLRPEAGIQSLTITPPKGQKQVLKRGSRPDFIFNETNELGVYTVVRDDEGQQLFAANLLDDNESNIQPRDNVKIGEEDFATGGQRQQPRPIWKWIVLLALGLFLVEWYVYNRRVYI